MNDSHSVRDASPASHFSLGGVLTISAGHLLHDTYSAFLAPLLPLLIERLSLSLTIAGTLTLFTGLPSLFQPFIGYVAERVNLRYFAVLAPILTATIMSLIGRAPNLGVLILMVTTVGLSSASFHAPAPATITRLSGSRLGLGLSLFTMAGELGRVLGPLLIVSAVSWWSLEGTYRLAFIGLVASALLYWQLRQLPLQPERKGWPALAPIVRDMRSSLLPIVALLATRAFILAAVSTYLPTFMTTKGASLWMAGASLSIIEMAGVAGVLVGGTLSDRWGRARVLQLAFLIAPGLMLAFLSVDGWAVFPLLVLLGFTSLSTMPVLMAVAMECFTENRATASGVFMALTFILGSIATVVIGFVGDHWGLQTAYTGSAIITWLGLPFTFLLPRRRPSITPVGA